MDEIEFKRTYNEACKAIEADDLKRAVLLCLQLINGLSERIDDMHVDD
jgi:hypothetical protein